MQARASRQGQRLHRRPVIRLCRRDHLPALRLAALDVVGARELQRELVGLGAAGDEAHPREPLRCDVEKLMREAFLLRIRQALVVDICELLGLPAGNLHEVPPAVAERRSHRAAAHRVEVALPFGVLQPDAFAPHHNRVAAVELRRQHERRG